MGYLARKTSERGLPGPDGMFRSPRHSSLNWRTVSLSSFLSLNFCLVDSSQSTKGSPGSQKPGASGSGDTGMEESTGPIMIAVVGKTRAGKTSFINAVTGMSLAVGHDLDSCELFLLRSKTKGN